MKNPSKYLGNELAYITKVLNSESWSSTMGSWVHGLERAFCEKFGMKYGIAMNSGTATLHCALSASGVGPGDEVISPALSVIMDATATLHAGATPVFADINPDTFLMDPADVERKVTDRTKAIITVSLYGLSPDMDPIMETAARHNLTVIEDNAQCFLGKYKNRLVGTMGQYSSFSFENSKHMSCGEGGILLTDNEKDAELARKISGHGYKNLKADEGRVRLNADVFQDPDYKRHDTVGWNYRMSEFSAAIALAQLERLDDFVEMRIRVANLFRDEMRGCPWLVPQHIPDDHINAYYTLAVRYEGEEMIGVPWKDFRQTYIDNGGDGFYGANAVPYTEPALMGRFMGDCRVAESVQKKLMCFKTNYRDMDLAMRKAEALGRTIRGYS